MPPSCLHCGATMTVATNVLFGGEGGVVFIMPMAFVCICGYKSIRGSDMVEFSQRHEQAQQRRKRRRAKQRRWR